jgi:hypothetical protein
MPDGILDFALVIRPLQSFSPTRYTAFLECPLRAVWSANGAQALLPVSPSARIGRVAHALLQEAGEGRFESSPENAINDRWQQLVTDEESDMEKSWLDRHFIPLRTADPQYEVRRIQSSKRALEISREAAAYKRGGTSAHKGEPQFGFEFPVSSHDGAIRGRIDAVLPSHAGPVLRDYKSGMPFEEGSQVVKKEYEIQLKLYAALYESSCGRWPSALELVSLTGVVQAIAIDPTTCTDLLKNATDALCRLNRTIASSRNVGELEQALARPSAKNCSYCQYRPGCRMYRKAAVAGEEWPKDIFGQVSLFQQLGNSKYMLMVRTIAGPVRIRALDSNLQRHPALGVVTVGDQIALFSLSVKTPNVYVESPYTTIYKLELGDAPRNDQRIDLHRC